MTRPERLKKAKLVPPHPPTHTQKLQQKILNLQHIQLQNIAPFKQISARLATRVDGVKHTLPRHTTPESAAPKSATVQDATVQDATVQDATAKNAVIAPTQSNPSKVAASLPFIKESSGSRLAFNLLLVRPWVLVIGFWLISMLSASLAWEGMISPKKLTMALPQPSASTTSTANKNSFLRVEQDTDDSGVQGSAPSREQRTLATKTTTADNANFPKWSIGALVGTCAAGCLGISRRRAMVRIASMRSRGRHKAHAHAAHTRSNNHRLFKKVVLRKAAKAASRPTGKPQQSRPATGQTIRNRSAASQPPSTLAAFKSAPSKKRRPRKRAAAMQHKPTVTGNRVLISRSTAPQNASATRSTGPRLVKRPATQGASHRQGVVSVLPASASHSLDWTNGSLAHQLDVRSQHTASM